MQWKRVADYMAAASKTMVALMVEEEEKEELGGEDEKGIEEGDKKGFSIKGLAPTTEKVAMPWVAPSMAPKFWTSGPVGVVAGSGTTISKRAQGKVPTTQT